MSKERTRLGSMTKRIKKITSAMGVENDDNVPYYIYILQCADGTFYIGSTNDVEKRLRAHNTSKSAAHYTKIRRPVVLKYTESFSTKSEALKRECMLKKITRAEKIRLVNL